VGIFQDAALSLAGIAVGYLTARHQNATERERIAVERQRVTDERDKLADDRADKELAARLAAYKDALDAERNLAYVRFRSSDSSRLDFLASLGQLERAADTVTMLASEDAAVALGALVELHRGGAVKSEAEKARDAFMRAIRADSGAAALDALRAAEEKEAS
jgi:hypothetical protein